MECFFQMLITALSTFLIVFITSIVIFMIYKLSSTKQDEEQELVNQQHTFEPKKMTCYSFTDLEEATSTFSQRNVIGDGGFGKVYKGVLNDRMVAIKRLSTDSTQGHPEYVAELHFLNLLYHKNIVQVYGYCSNGLERLIVYEFCSNADLYSHFQDEVRRRTLTWPIRLHLIKGVASGMHYMHVKSVVKTIHRDIKLSNILIDDEWTAKIADFGTAVTPTFDDNSRILGTFRYGDPDYLLSRAKLCEKVDIFCFGVLLLMVVSGKPVNLDNENGHTIHIVEDAWNLWVSGRMLEFRDHVAVDTYDDAEFQKMYHVALLCVQKQRDARPDADQLLDLMFSGGNPPEPTAPQLS